MAQAKEQKQKSLSSFEALGQELLSDDELKQHYAEREAEKARKKAEREERERKQKEIQEEKRREKMFNDIQLLILKNPKVNHVKSKRWSKKKDQAYSREEIYLTLTMIYRSEKGKSFFLHLVRCFVPPFRVKVKSSYPSKQKGVCALSKQRLVGIDEINDEAALNEIREYMNESIMATIEARDLPPQPDESKIAGRMIGVGSDYSSIFLSYDALLTLYQFTVNMLAQENDKELKNEVGKILWRHKMI